MSMLALALIGSRRSLNAGIVSSDTGERPDDDLITTRS
jgi:hypothetical protein